MCILGFARAPTATSRPSPFTKSLRAGSTAWLSRRHVAKLAGVPRAVTERAAKILDMLESQHVNDEGKPKVPKRESKKAAKQQLSLFELPEDPLLDEIRALDVDDMTPRQAMDELYRLRQELTARKV